LLGPIGESINTAFNQIFDAATRQNTGGGFIGKGLRLKAGQIRFKPGEYQFVDASGGAIRDSIVTVDAPQPSAVLFQLIGLLIEAARDISATKDILTGEQNQSNVPATTTLALIEQGMKVFTAIFKRIHRSLKHELKKLFVLNGRYLQPEEYFQILDRQEKVYLADYNEKDTDITPISDPTIVTEAQQMGRAQALLPFAQDPMFDGLEIKKRYLKAIGVEDVDSLLAKEQGGPPPEVMKLMAEIKNANKLAQAKAVQMYADSILKIANAEAAEKGTQLQAYQAGIDSIFQYLEAQRNGGATDESGMGGMGGEPGDPGAEAVPQEQLGGPENDMGVGSVDPGLGGGIPPEELGGGDPGAAPV
jgi:chaperonin GroES